MYRPPLVFPPRRFSYPRGHHTFFLRFLVAHLAFSFRGSSQLFTLPGRSSHLLLLQAPLIFFPLLPPLSLYVPVCSSRLLLLYSLRFLTHPPLSFPFVPSRPLLLASLTTLLCFSLHLSVSLSPSLLPSAPHGSSFSLFLLWSSQFLPSPRVRFGPLWPIRSGATWRRPAIRSH